MGTMSKMTLKEPGHSREQEVGVSSCVIPNSFGNHQKDPEEMFEKGLGVVVTKMGGTGYTAPASGSTAPKEAPCALAVRLTLPGAAARETPGAQQAA